MAISANALRDLPIRQKLIVVVMVTTAAALVVSGLGVGLTDALLFRRSLERDLSALAHIIADNSTAALAFEDPRAATDTLAALKARAHLVAACIYQADGRLFASYTRPGSAAACPAAAGGDFKFTTQNVTVRQPIVLTGKTLGGLVILYDLGEMYDRMVLYGGTVIGVLLLSSFIAFLLSSRLREIIEVPISKLVHAAASISRTRDYSIRAEKVTGDELGVLADSFNAMLTRVESSDAELRSALVAREEALGQARAARDSLETTLSSIADAVLSTDMEGRVVFANPVALSLSGYSEDEVTARPLDEILRIVDELSRTPLESPAAKAVRENRVVATANHAILVRRNGMEIPIDNSAAPIRGEDGTIQGAVVVFRDVSEQRRAEETRQLLASIVESSDDAIVGQDLKGMVVSWNRGAERIFGYSREEVVGRPVAILAGPQGDEMPHVLEDVSRGERVEEYQAFRRTRNGAVINVSIAISPVYDAVGRIIGASSIVRDITDVVRTAERLANLNADLRASNEKLARSNEDLQRFAWVASHDLQEPLRMITVYSQLLVQQFPSEDGKAAMFMANIIGGTKRMRELLADLLAYTEIGARTEVPLSVVDLNSVLAKVLQNLKVSIDESGAVVTSDSLPQLNAYEGHFMPLIQNLIGNAIKYRGKEPPRIHVGVEQSGDELRLSVSDNGIGIEPQYQQKIFGAFKRLHGNEIPGTGIGLAICQRVVERYGGRIWVESEVGRGSTFFFTVPARAGVGGKASAAYNPKT